MMKKVVHSLLVILSFNNSFSQNNSSLFNHEDQFGNWEYWDFHDDCSLSTTFKYRTKICTTVVDDKKGFVAHPIDNEIEVMPVDDLKGTEIMGTMYIIGQTKKYNPSLDYYESVIDTVEQFFGIDNNSGNKYAIINSLNFSSIDKIYFNVSPRTNLTTPKDFYTAAMGVNNEKAALNFKISLANTCNCIHKNQKGHWESYKAYNYIVEISIVNYVGSKIGVNSYSLDFDKLSTQESLISLSSKTECIGDGHEKIQDKLHQSKSVKVNLVNKLIINDKVSKNVATLNFWSACTLTDLTTPPFVAHINYDKIK